jgi:uncharacterized membrane protein
MGKFLGLVLLAVAIAALSYGLYRKAPSRRTRMFLAVAGISALAFPIAAVLHNAVDALFHVEEPVFFLIAVIGAPIGVVVGVIGAALSTYWGRFARR